MATTTFMSGLVIYRWHGICGKVYYRATPGTEPCGEPEPAASSQSGGLRKDSERLEDEDEDEGEEGSGGEEKVMIE